MRRFTNCSSGILSTVAVASGERENAIDETRPGKENCILPSALSRSDPAVLLKNYPDSL